MVVVGTPFPLPCTTVVVVVELAVLVVAPLMAAAVRFYKAAGLAGFAAMFGSLIMNVFILLFVMIFVTTFWSFFEPGIVRRL